MVGYHKPEPAPKNLREIYALKATRELKNRLAELEPKLKKVNAKLLIGGGDLSAKRALELSSQLMTQAIKLIKAELTTRGPSGKY